MSQQGSKRLPDTLILQEGLSLDEVEERLGLAYIAVGLKHRACAFYLQEIDARELYKMAGYGSTARYAAHRFGMSRREARDLLAAGKALVDLYAIDDAFGRGKLCWSKVRELVKVATSEHEQKWLEAALELSIDELVLEVRLSKPGEPPRRRDERKGLPEVRIRLNTQLPADVFAEWEQIKRRLQAESDQPLAEWECVAAMLEITRAALEGADDRNDKRKKGRTGVVVVHVGDSPATPATVETEDGPVPLDSVTAEVICCDAMHFDPSKPKGQGKYEVPLWLRLKVLARDGFRCRCCKATRLIQEHHVLPWSEGGLTEFENLLTLCRFCHTLVHAKLIRIVGSNEREWRFVDRHGREINGSEVRLMDFMGQLTDGGTRRLYLRREASAPDGPAESGGTMCHTRFADLVGQETVIESLRVAVGAARVHDEPVGHTLLAGRPGLGKTTLARAVAAERGVPIHEAAGSEVHSVYELNRLLARVGRNEVLFIDEIHGLARPVAESLYRAMDGQTFTLIGATTEPGQLPASFKSRFQNRELLKAYGPAELAELTRRAAGCEGIEIDPRAARELAEVSRETRVALN